MFYSDKMLRALFLLVLSVFLGRRAFTEGGEGVIVRSLDSGAPRSTAMPCLRSGGHRADSPAIIDPAFLPPAAFGIGFLRS